MPVAPRSATGGTRPGLQQVRVRRRGEVDADADRERAAVRPRSPAGCRRACRPSSSTSFGHFSAKQLRAGRSPPPARRCSASAADERAQRRGRRRPRQRHQQGRGEVARPATPRPARAGPAPRSARGRGSSSGPVSPAAARRSASALVLSSVAVDLAADARGPGRHRSVARAWRRPRRRSSRPRTG